MGSYGERSRLGHDAERIGESNSHDVGAAAVKPVEAVARSAVPYGCHRPAVESHRIARRAGNGLPAERAVAVSERGFKRVIGKSEFIGISVRPACGDFELYGVFRSFRPSGAGYGVKVDAVCICRYRSLPAVVNYRVACSALRRPAERGSGQAYVGGESGGYLLVVVLARRRRIEAVRNGGDRNFIIACGHLFE